MKELHDHIFSNTTCISKEIMLKYINNQLSVKELHEVEKHLLDCEFCSEALEGLKYAENSSILFAIDNQIDQRVRGGGAKSPVMRNLMVAASILILFTVAFFTFDYFDGTVSNQSNLALKETTEKSVEESKMSKNKDGKMEIEEVTGASAVDEQHNSTSTATNSQSGEGMNVLDDDRVAQAESMDEAPMEDANVPMSNEVDLLMEELADEEEELKDNLKAQDFTTALEREENESTTEPASVSSGSAVNGNVLTKKTEAKTSNDGDSNRNKKDKRKAKGNKKRSMSPGYMSETATEEQKPLAGDGLTTITLSSYKVVDYTDEYQQQYDLKNTIETKSVPADFATEEDKEIAEKEKEELEVALTYKESLEKGMAYFKLDKYIQALEQFNIILKQHPSEVNCQFYSGLSYYRLDQYHNANTIFDQVLQNERKEFEEEAYWYKALTLIELSKIDEAKKLLEQIVKGKGFYSNQAKEKLNDL